MNMKAYRLALVGSLFALASLSFAQVSLKRTAKEGDTFTYKIKADLDFQGMSAQFTSKMTEKVVKIAADGTITSESSQAETKVKLGDEEMDAPDSGGTQTSIFKPNGEIVEMKGDMVDANAYRVAYMNSFFAPETAVKEGDSWEKKIAADSKTGMVAAVAKYKVEKAEKVGAYDTFLLTYEYKESTGDAPASSSGKVWVNTKDGSLVKFEGEWKNAPIAGAPMPISAKVFIERV